MAMSGILRTLDFCLTFDGTKTLDVSLVLSRTDCCSSLLAALDHSIHVVKHHSTVYHVF